MTKKIYRVAIVFPADPELRQKTSLEGSRFAKTAQAISETGIEVVGAPYIDADVDVVRAMLMGVDGVLVWINPIVDGRDRSILNQMLAEVASVGVLVSANPQVIEKMGTKEVLYRTRQMSWGCDTQHYRTPDIMRAGLIKTLASGSPRVLKRIRGQSGDGVWKVELDGGNLQPASGRSELDDISIRVKHAKRGSVEQTMPLADFIASSAPYLAADGGIIDQVYQPRLTEGMVRCYLVADRVAGFGEQLINALYPAKQGAAPHTAPEPGPRLYYPPTRPDFQRLKNRLEREWLDELCATVGIEKRDLPLLWDADFLYGPQDADGADTYVLCEINVSSVYPFPDDALVPLAVATRSRLADHQ